MTPTTRSLVLTVGLWLVATNVAPLAKGTTRRLVVTGPTLPALLEITDPAALANVWGGEFLGAPAAEPDPAWPRFEVAFYVQTPRSDVMSKRYVVVYVRDPDSLAGFVYLPGRGEEWYRLNVSTILRDGQDGRSHRAADVWNQAITSRLADGRIQLR
jgi:hypothetical protein